MSYDSGISIKAIALIIVLFVLGIALGAVGQHLWTAHELKDQRRARVVAQLKSELQLSVDQEKKFDAIITDESAKFHELRSQEHAEWDPKFRDLAAQRDAEWAHKLDQARQQGRDSIRAILNPVQQARFDAFFKKYDEDQKKPQQQR